jgi:hypothetical protein
VTGLLFCRALKNKSLKKEGFFYGDEDPKTGAFMPSIKLTYLVTACKNIESAAESLSQ